MKNDVRYITGCLGLTAGSVVKNRILKLLWDGIKLQYRVCTHRVWNKNVKADYSKLWCIFHYLIVKQYFTIHSVFLGLTSSRIERNFKSVRPTRWVRGLHSDPTIAGSIPVTACDGGDT